MSSIYKSASKPSFGATLAQKLKTELNSGRRLANLDAQTVQVMIGMESYNDTAAANLQTGFESSKVLLKDSYNQAASDSGLQTSFEDLTDAQKEAGALIAMAYSNAGAYARAGYTRRAENVSNENFTTFDSVPYMDHSTTDFRPQVHVALESFDNTELQKFIGYSITFNMQAARQDEFGEALYPTVVVSPEQGGLDVRARIYTVFNEIRHSLTGKPTDFQQKNLLDALVDGSILAADSLQLVPYFQTGVAANVAMFVPVADVPAETVVVDGVSVPTAALKIDTEIGLIAISQHPGLLATGVMDNSDALDGKLSLKNIYIKSDNGTNVEHFKLNVFRLPLSSFNKTVEGRDRKMGLQFSSDAVIIDGAVKDVTGGTPTTTVLLTAGNYKVYLHVEVFGTADVEYGTIKVMAGSVSVAKMLDVNGAVVADITAGAPAAALTQLGTLTIVGYDLDARRTNSNRRTRGLLANSYDVVERYQIPIGSPLSIPAPINSDTDAVDVNTLVTTARIRNSNMAVRALLSYADHLKAFVRPDQDENEITNVHGIGRHYVKPYYNEILALDLAARVNSISTHERIADVRAALTSVIRDEAYKMLVQSRYRPALEQLTNFSGDKPHVQIATDQNLAQYIMVDGDSRTIGPDLDASIVTTVNKDIRNAIYLTFTRKQATSEPSPLSFGVHGWVPEMTSIVQVNRNGATIKEVMVQPRNYHINMLPVLVKITIDPAKLTAAIGEKTKAPTT